MTGVPALPARCGTCGHRMTDAQQWCSLCLTPKAVPPPEPPAVVVGASPGGVPPVGRLRAPLRGPAAAAVVLVLTLVLTGVLVPVVAGSALARRAAVAHSSGHGASPGGPLEGVPFEERP